MSELYIHYSREKFMKYGPYYPDGKQRDITQNYKKVKKQLLDDMKIFREGQGSLTKKDIQELSDAMSMYFTVVKAQNDIQKPKVNIQLINKLYADFLSQAVNPKTIQDSWLDKIITDTSNPAWSKAIEDIENNKSNITGINSIFEKGVQAEVEKIYYENMEGVALLQTELINIFQDCNKEYYDKIISKIEKYLDETGKEGKVSHRIRGREEYVKELYIAMLNAAENAFNGKNFDKTELSNAIMNFTQYFDKNNVSITRDEKGLTQELHFLVDEIGFKPMENITVKNNKSFNLLQTEANRHGVIGEQFVKFLLQKAYKEANKAITDSIRVTGGKPLPTLEQKTLGNRNISESIKKQYSAHQSLLFNTQTSIEETNKGIKTQIKPDVIYTNSFNKEIKISVKNYKGSSPSLEEQTLSKILSYRDRESQYIFLNASVKQENDTGEYLNQKNKIVQVLACWALAAGLGGMRVGRQAANIFLYINSKTNTVYIVDIEKKLKDLLKSIESDKMPNFHSEFSEGQSILDKIASQEGILNNWEDNEKQKNKKEALSRSETIANSIWSEYQTQKIKITIPIKYLS